jgi:lipoprotein-releasing system ATP-binding protein
MQVIVELRGVHHGFGSTEVLRGIDLRVAAGQSLAITGPSGAGKSTLLHILGGMLPPRRGQVLLAGADLTAIGSDECARVRHRAVGFVFQAHHLLPQCSALENVLLPTLAHARRAAPHDVARARELLASVGLGTRMQDAPAQLSAGECQRVALARALIMAPPLLLADEPTGALDAENADAVAELLCACQARQRTALVVVTHAPRLAARMQSQLVLAGGRLLAP